jgi:hypothetical protein
LICAVLELLVEKGADVDEKDADGMTAVHTAARKTCPRRIFRRVVELSKDIDKRDGNKDTALSLLFSEKKDKEERLKILLEKKSDPVHLLDGSDGEKFAMDLLEISGIYEYLVADGLLHRMMAKAIEQKQVKFLRASFQKISGRKVFTELEKKRKNVFEFLAITAQKQLNRQHDLDHGQVKESRRQHDLDPQGKQSSRLRDLVKPVVLYGVGLLQEAACQLVDLKEKCDDSSDTISITWGVLSTAYENNWEKFLGRRLVVAEINRRWWSSFPDSSITKYLLQSVGIGKAKSDEEPGVCPAHLNITGALFYVVFLCLLFFNLKRGPRLQTNLNGTEWCIYVYFWALVVQEVERVYFYKSDYLKMWTTRVNIIMILTFLAYFTTRFLSTVVESDDTRMEAMRVASYLMGIATLLACLQLLPHLVTVPQLGSMIVSFTEIVPRAGIFLIILAIFLIAFSLGTTGIYQGTFYTSSAGEINQRVGSVWYWMRNFVWTLVGFDSLEMLEVESSAETIAGKVLVSLWKIITTLVLTSLIIALVTNAFDAVQNQERAEEVTAIVKMKYMISVRNRLPFPLPFNLFRLFIKFIVCCFGRGKEYYQMRRGKGAYQKLCETSINQDDSERGTRQVENQDSIGQQI